VCGLTFPLWSYREGQTLKRDVRSRPGGAIELPEIVSYLRAANVPDGIIDYSDVLMMNFSPNEFEKYELKPFDILLNEGQSLELVGRAAMYRGEAPGTCFQKTLIRFRAARGVIPTFALIVFRGYMHGGVFRRVSRWTTSMAHLTAERFLVLEFPLPPLAEQERIVAEVERRLSVIEKAEAAVEANLKRAERMRQAILKRSFEGKLVPQDPSDEPASVLLERIRAEREQAAATASRRRGRPSTAASAKDGSARNGQLRLLDADEAVAARQRVIRGGLS